MPQLAEAGYSPSDITHLALSHYHYDHTANANAFASATWLVRQVERDAMFAAKPPGVTRPSSYAALKNSKTVIIESDEYDASGTTAAAQSSLFEDSDREAEKNGLSGTRDPGLR